MSHANLQFGQCRVVLRLEDLLSEEVRFQCLYVDVPWEFRNQASRAAATNHYCTLDIETVKSLPIPLLAAETAHLHLWAPNAMLEGCLDVIGAWGFEYKTNFAWVKPNLGLGNYWRSSHELLLLGVRGSLPFRVKDQRSWHEAPRTEHSTKPDSIRAIVERVSPGPYLELFGRRTVPGWTVFGNQVERRLF